MPTRVGHPVRGALDVAAWRAALQRWLTLLFGDGAASWRVAVSERPAEQFKSSKRRDDVRFTRTAGDGSEEAFRTFAADTARAHALGRSMAHIIDAAAQVSGPPRPREPREPPPAAARDDDATSSSSDAEVVRPARPRTAPRDAPPRVARVAAQAAPDPPPCAGGRAADAAPPLGPTGTAAAHIAVSVQLPDGRTVELKMGPEDVVQHVWRALRSRGVARDGRVLVAMLADAQRRGGAVRFNCCDAQPLDELLEPDARGRPRPGAIVQLRVLAAGD